MACITAGAPNQKLAEEWINLHLSAPCMLAYARQTYYSPTVDNAPLPADLPAQADHPAGRRQAGLLRLGRGQSQPAQVGEPVQSGNRGVRRWLGPALAAPATLWLLIAFATPAILVLLLSFQADGLDTFAPISLIPSLDQYKIIFGDPFYAGVLARTTLLAMGVSLAAVILGYPLALWIVSLKPSRRPLAIAAVLTPLLVNVVVRSLGVELLLAPDGLINTGLGWLHLPRAPRLLYNYGAIAVGLVQVFLPFMVLSLYDVLQSTPPRVLEAAESLGASGPVRFFNVQLPLSLPGLRAGVTFVFLMASTTYVSARMLGGKVAWTTGMVVWQEVLENLNAPLASALAMVMTVIAVAAGLLIAFAAGRLTPWLSLRPARAAAMPSLAVKALNLAAPVVSRSLTILSLGLLLLPLVLVFVQSFNDVPQATMAGFRRFTLHWYAQLFSQGLYLDSFWVSLKLAAVTAVVTVMLATAGGLLHWRAPASSPSPCWPASGSRRSLCRRSPSASACCGCCRPSPPCRPSSASWPCT